MKKIKRTGGEEQIIWLEKRINQCYKNANKQRNKLLDGKDVRVRPQFWEQVANDYQRQLNRLKFKTHNKELKQTEHLQYYNKP